MSTLGNSQDFGDLAVAKGYAMAASSPVRGVLAGGSNPTIQTEITQITINTLGNSYSFGDLSAARASGGGCSNAHGGL